jgi:galactose mutarotase-like enzyme
MDEWIVISAPQSKARILPSRGGLLTGLTLNNQELLYLPEEFSPHESGWPGGGAPILFPFAGRSFYKGEALKYQYGDKVVRPMPLHGFAYAKPFEVIEEVKSGVRLQLVDDANTREIYPFSFELILDFSITSNALALGISIRNTGETPMPVAMGWHPYFGFPRERNDLERMRLICEASEAMHVTNSGAAGTSYRASSPFRLGDPLYKSHILGGFEGKYAKLEDPLRDVQIELDWHEADSINYLVLWTGDDQRYFCVEPWMGLPDSVHTGIGLQKILPSESLHSKIFIKAQ